MAADAGERIALLVSDVVAEARDVLLVELRDPAGKELPPFEPGAHLEIDLPNGMVRHYSLVNDSRERDRYVIGVGRAAAGRGGSEFVHRSLRQGVVLRSSPPRNNFRLDPSAGRFLFIAGGIGITPIMSMLRACEAAGRPWRLVYAVRSAQRAAFLETLRPFGARVRLHVDDQVEGVLDVAGCVAGLGADEHVCCCGPAPLMDAVRVHTERLDPRRIHFEYFTAAPADAAASSAGAFEIELRRSGRRLPVPTGRSILEIVEAAGLSVPFSCREGLCRTCETTVLEGVPEHCDYVLSTEERAANRTMMICVSRSLSPLLALDL